MAFTVAVGRPILVRGSIEIEGTLNVNAGKTTGERHLTEKEEIEFIDEHQVLDKDNEGGMSGLGFVTLDEQLGEAAEREGFSLALAT